MHTSDEALFCRGERGQGVDEFEIWYQHRDGEFRECDDSHECLEDHLDHNQDTPTFIQLSDYIDLVMELQELRK